MKKLLLLLCLTAPCFAQESEKVYTHEELRLLDPLPDHVYSMPRAKYIEWGKLHNDGAYLAAAEAAKAFRDKIPYNPTYVSTTTGSVDTAVITDRDNHYNVCGTMSMRDYLARTYYASSTTFRSFEDRNSWGGGPVIVINPFAKRPAKVMEYNGRRYLADPDDTIKDKEAAKKFLENN